MKIKKLNIQINTIGCKVCRPAYRKKLLDYYRGKDKLICADCSRRLKINPLRILDCKKESCQPLIREAPIMIDNLCSNCKKHFKAVLEYLEVLSLPYSLNHHLVRGFDYYTRTVFEIFSESFDSALAAGGRYDYLIEMLGGRHTPAVGGAVGLERLKEIIKEQNINLGFKSKPKVFFIHIGESAKRKGLAIIEVLLGGGIEVAESLGKESLKAQLKAGDKLGAPLALILGQQEVFEESVIIRDMKTGAQETVSLKKLVDVVKRKLR